ncbi:cell division protein FtsZ [Candidatus Woesearchaeota archaeon]|jgi:cell division protein FtsZ|nr:cell division protein FtsZ [Candidatus Woesearchaeota archaeon]MBT5740586.1 cell division protein FtsZ [Candidatus Woesearchaeota archaeon]
MYEEQRGEYQQPNGQPTIQTQEISHKKANQDLDDELQQLIASQKTRIKVVGCGGAGNNTINRISEVGVKGIETIAINTDAQDLLYTNAEKKLLIGKELTQGLGAGSNPKVGEAAAKENEGELKKLITGSDMIFITAGLGGGTGTGSAPFMAALAKKMGILSVGIVTIPFTMEGSHRFENAITGLERMEQSVNTLIVIPNEKLLELAPHLPLQTAFKVADEILTNAVKGVAELVTKAGLVNLDFADVKAIMSEGGVAMIGVGESDSEHRASESVQKALENPLIDVDISDATGALINISGGDSLTLDDSRQIVEAVAERLDPKAKIIWGAQIYKDLEKTIRTMLIVTGVNSEQIFGEGHQLFTQRQQAMESELGIDIVN